jgi:hypothetical protein
LPQAPPAVAQGAQDAGTVETLSLAVVAEAHGVLSVPLSLCQVQIAPKRACPGAGESYPATDENVQELSRFSPQGLRRGVRCE